MCSRLINIIDDFPYHKHDLMCSCLIRKLNFSLEWHRGHPEDRHETADTWSREDWMNHIADRLADAEHGRDGGVDAPGCLRQQGRWRLLHEGNRVTSLTPDALDLLRRRH